MYLLYYKLENRGFTMAKENATLDSLQISESNSSEPFDFDALEETLQEQLQQELDGLEVLEDEKEQIENPDSLGKVVGDVVWEQFVNQIAATAGEDFIKENNGLQLDLRNEAHIQTTENFANGKIANHNTKINYQQRYDDWQSNFVKDENGNVVTHTTRSGKQEATLVKGARAPFDKGRPTGSATAHTDQDHTIPAAEIIRDPAANAHRTKEEQIKFANSNANLNKIDSRKNRSKGDKSMSDWLDNPNSKGQKPTEIFDISTEEEAALRQKDAEAREEYKKQIAEGEKRSVEAGKQSQKEEAFRIGSKALRAVITQLLAALVKEIVAKLIKWFKLAKRTLDSLLSSLNEAIHGFILKLKENLLNAGNTLLNTVAAAIVGPVFSTIKKVWMLLKQGWKSLKDAVNYIKEPENKGKPLNRLLLETGKIVIAGLTGAGSIVLSEVIEKGLTAIPVFAVEIPLLGSLASILGIFFGAVVAGIIGAIAINLIEKQIAKNQKAENTSAQIDKRNDILRIQHQIQSVSEKHTAQTKDAAMTTIKQRHEAAAEFMRQSFSDIAESRRKDDAIDSTFDDIDDLFKELEDF